MPNTITRCGACRAKIVAPEWRHRRFCSLACANRGRPRRGRNPQRTLRILDLHAKGLTAPTICAMLEVEDPSWAMTAVNVRSVISRMTRSV